MKKRYYLCDYSVEVDEIGWFPQCHQFVDGISESQRQKFYRVDKAASQTKTKLAKDIRHLNGLKIFGWAKRTDILSCIVPAIPCLDEKTMNVFKNFDLGNHYFIPTKFDRRGKIFNYWFLYVANPVLQFLNYPECKFLERGLLSGPAPFPVEPIGSYAEFLEYLKHLRQCSRVIEPLKIVMNSDFPDSLDMFTIYDLFLSQFFLSERLCDALKANRISGLEVTDFTIDIE